MKNKLNEKSKKPFKIKWVAIVIAFAVILVSVIVGIKIHNSQNESETKKEESLEVTDEDIVCNETAVFSGQFVEDGRDELVENVAAIRVTNTSGRFIDLCTMKYEINGKEACFVVTGLPAGRSAWVMEQSKMVVSDNTGFVYKECTTAFKDGVVTSTDKITISADGNMLTAKNNTNETLENVFVYYKTLHTDGNFFGGITYMIDFGTLEPGESLEKLAGHYKEESTEIVRIGWLDS